MRYGFMSYRRAIIEILPAKFVTQFVSLLRKILKAKQRSDVYCLLIFWKSTTPHYCIIGSIETVHIVVEKFDAVCRLENIYRGRQVFSHICRYLRIYLSMIFVYFKTLKSHLKSSNTPYPTPLLLTSFMDVPLSVL